MSSIKKKTILSPLEVEYMENKKLVLNRKAAFKGYTMPEDSVALSFEQQEVHDSSVVQRSSHAVTFEEKQALMLAFLVHV
jgi:hypothetical protein